MTPIRHRQGLRLVALFEAAKGALGVLVGLGLLSLVHRDLAETAARFTDYLHLSRTSHYPRLLIETATRMDGRVGLWAGIAFAYALFRFIEGYGLWRGRAWAEWVAVLSAAIYVPFEVYELLREVTAIRLGILLSNAALVAYLTWVLATQVKLRRANGAQESRFSAGEPFT